MNPPIQGPPFVPYDGSIEITVCVPDAGATILLLSLELVLLFVFLKLRKVS